MGGGSDLAEPGEGPRFSRKSHRERKYLSSSKLGPALRSISPEVLPLLWESEARQPVPPTPQQTTRGGTFAINIWGAAAVDKEGGWRVSPP